MAERRRYPDTGVRPTVDPQQISPNDAHRCQAEPTEQEEVIMSEPFIFINSFEIKEGKLLGEFLTVVESNEPRLLALNAYVNEDGTEVTFVQVHPDAASLEHHQSEWPTSTPGGHGSSSAPSRASRSTAPPTMSS